MAHIQTESEWELEMCGKIVDYLAGKIYVDMRFMEPVLNVLVPRANMGLSTFATAGRIRLFLRCFISAPIKVPLRKAAKRRRGVE